MAVALMVVPGIAAAWAWARPRGARFLRPALGAAGAAVAVGGAWPLLVALTPASDRPWISGTADNSIWSLIWGYNGLGRIDGQAGGPGGAGPGGGGGGTFFGESPGPFRLLNSALGGQAGWLLGFALVGGIAIALASRLRRDDARTGWLLAVGGGFVTTGVAFSAAKGIFHPYYVSLMAPFTAGLVGAGAAQLARGGRQMRVLAPVAVAAGVATELAVLHNSQGSLTWLPTVLIVLGLAAIVALAAANVARMRVAIIAAALGLLLIAPASWAVQTLGHQTSGTFPAGGPASVGMGGGLGGGGGFGGPRGGMAPPNGAGGFGGGLPVAAAPMPTQRGGMFGGNSAALTAALSYAKANGGGAVAVSSQQGASSSIINSGANVVALGGFSGRESEVSISWLAQAVRSGQVRYVLVDSSSGGMPNDSRTGSQSVMAAAAEVGTKVTLSSSSGGTLYDLQGHADELAALAA